LATVVFIEISEKRKIMKETYRFVNRAMDERRKKQKGIRIGLLPSLLEFDRRIFDHNP